MTINEIQEEIIKEFEKFNTWQEKYNYLIKIGKNLPPLDEKYKTEENLIKGCQVKTWFHSTFKDGKLFFEIDSLSLIVRGIIALLIRIFSGQKPEDIKNASLDFVKKIGLEENFSPFKENSLFKIVNRIKSEAELYESRKD